MGEEHHDGGLQISPLLVGLLGVMAGSLIVATFHCIIVCWCSDMSTVRGIRPPSPNVRQRPNNQQEASSSRSFSTVQLIIASNYSQDCKEETCAVCLTEFIEGDEVRFLPICAHVFHVPCIDKWLLSHSNCPLCRADTLRSASQDSIAVPQHSSGMPLSPDL